MTKVRFLTALATVTLVVAGMSLEAPEQMRVFDASFPLPKHALEPGSTVKF